MLIVRAGSVERETSLSRGSDCWGTSHNALRCFPHCPLFHFWCLYMQLLLLTFFPPVVLFFVFFLYASLFFLLFPLTPSWSWEKADPVWAWFCWTISLFCFLVHRGFSRFSLLHFKIPTLQCRESKDDCCCKLSFWNSVSVFSEDEKKATMIADVEHALLQKPEIFCIYLFFPKSLINDWRSKLYFT